MKVCLQVPLRYDKMIVWKWWRHRRNTHLSLHSYSERMARRRQIAVSFVLVGNTEHTMPKKPNAKGMQEYIPAGNGDASGEYADGDGNNKHFESFKKPEVSQPIIENKNIEEKPVESEYKNEYIEYEESRVKELEQKLKRRITKKDKEIKKSFGEKNSCCFWQ